MNIFKNTGMKLNKLAWIFFVITAVSGVISGCILMADGHEDEILIGIVLILAGIILGYVGGLVLAAFGELVDAAQNSERYLSVMADKMADKKGSATTTNSRQQDTPNSIPEDPARIPTWKRIQMEQE